MWTSAVAFATCVKPRKMLWSGLTTGLAILFIPQLFRLTAAIALFILFRPERTRTETRKAVLMYAVAVGAGSLAFLFADGFEIPSSGEFVERDVGTAARGLLSLNAAIAGAAALAPVLLPGALTMLLLGLFAINVVVSLPAISADEWRSLEELLPTLPLLFVLGAAAIDAVWRRWISPRRGSVALWSS